MAKNDGRERPYTIAVTCSAEEKKKIEDKAKAVGLSASAYARIVLLGVDNPLEKLLSN